ncbi:MAG TPA: DNA polymerase/3'-5' exonuclease PolX, partial [Clostridia bacterium]|nr:DNA polymerase/3'-5' exonuclease PolX [Clostridia bacterium]
RRRKSTIGDLDILVCGTDSEKIMKYFNDYEDVNQVLLSGETKSSVLLNDGIQVDLRLVKKENYGSALQYFTGSKEHSVKLRKTSKEQGLKINEYGIFDGDERSGGAEEKDMYEILGLPYIEPELRENRGELEIKQASDLPDLITLEDIKGDLQMHTDASDGNNTMVEMIEAAIEKGYQYIAITDHSKRVTIANGLDVKRVKKQIEKIDKMNEKYDDIKILKSMEVDILKDGSLDLPEDILSKLDIRICAIHYNTNLSREDQTKRMIKAIENPFCDIIAHPTGRIILDREPYAIDLDQVMVAAKENDCILEINAQPERLDLSDQYIKKAVEMNVKLVISTDAHSTGGLENMKYGVYQARRGWCSANDVVNTLALSDLLSLINKEGSKS